MGFALRSWHVSELPGARIEPRTALERWRVAAAPSLVLATRILGFVVRISIVAAVPVLFLGLCWLLLGG
jgi:hypothetical protein